MAVRSISRTTIVAVLVAMMAALAARSWLQVRLLQNGMQSTLASDVSYLMVPLILVLLLFPLWRDEKSFLSAQFRRRDLSRRLVLNAVAVGILTRLLWWSQLIAGVSFGAYSSSIPDAVVGPLFSFRCDSPGVVLLGFLVLAFFVPLIEEIVHRGYVQSALHRYGLIKAVILSAFIFALFHRISSWPSVFFAGIIFGLQYWSTRSLWSSLISHATINGLILLDWRCLSGYWNPRAEDIPLLTSGIISVAVMGVCISGLVCLLRKMATEARLSPR